MTTSGYAKLPVDPTDPRFPSFLQGFNRRWSAPGLGAVYLRQSAQGTAAALDDALACYGGGIKIKSGGHCYENFVFNDGTRAILDVTPMAAAGVDEQRGYYLDAGGTCWSAFEALFRRYGRVLPAGSCYSMGLGGHICGGGFGLLSHEACDGQSAIIKPLLDELAAITPHRRVQQRIVGHMGWSTAVHDDCDTSQILTFYEAAQTLNGSGPNQRGKYKSAYMRKPFPSDQVQAIFEALQVVPRGLQSVDMRQSLLQVDTYGGAINDIDAAATPIPCPS